MAPLNDMVASILLIAAISASLFDTSSALDIVDAKDASSYLATERTFLAWVRTALAVLGFGLAFANLFPFKIAGHHMGSFIAISSIISSLILLINATVRYYETIDRLEHGKFVQSPVGPAMLVVVVVLLILVPALIGGRKQYKIKKALTDGEEYEDDEEPGSEDTHSTYASKYTLIKGGGQDISKTIMGGSQRNKTKTNENTDALLREVCLNISHLIKVIENQNQKPT